MCNECFYGSPAGRVRAAHELVQGCCVRGKMPVASWREESAMGGGSEVTRGAGGSKAGGTVAAGHPAAQTAKAGGPKFLLHLELKTYRKCENVIFFFFFARAFAGDGCTALEAVGRRSREAS